MNKKKTIIYSFLFLAIGCFLTACFADYKEKKQDEVVPEYVFTYADNQTEDYPTVQAAIYFAELVEERTKGRIQIDINANAVLGDESSVMEQMKFGGIDFARLSLTVLAEEEERLNVLQLPYIYRDAEHMWKVLDGSTGDKFLEITETTGLVGLSWYDAGARSFYTSKKPIRTAEDIKGLRIRVIDSKLMIDMVNALGAVAVPLLYDEVYSGMQTGVLDGAENNFPSYESMKHYEVAGYYTLDEHTRVPEVQAVSAVTWNKLSESDRKIIRSCAEESALYERELWKKYNEESLDKLKANGAEIIELPQSEIDKFRKAVLPLYEKYCSEYMDLVDEIINTK
ncbi:MAG: TRAP transporter substrate-binding protein [Eubacteriales bacterium]|nr:TRAP transporter substrate-binding protein [Eubacteriales bacterium]